MTAANEKPSSNSKLGGQQEANDNEVKGDKFNWIGISIDMKTLGLVPNIQLTKE
jgi:hypothetical protein